MKLAAVEYLVDPRRTQADRFGYGPDAGTLSVGGSDRLVPRFGGGLGGFVG